MKTVGIAFCAIVASAGTAFGQSVENFTQIDEVRMFDVRSGQWVASSSIGDRTDHTPIQTIYSNIDFATTGGVQHSTAGEVIGDDITPAAFIAPSGGGTVRQVTISIANFGADIVGQDVSLDLVFFRNDGSGIGGIPIAGSVIGTIAINIPSFNLSGATFGLFSFTGLTSSQLSLTSDDFWLGVRFNSVGLSDGTQLGQVFYTGGSIGSSDNTEYFQDSVSANPRFNAGTTNNFGYEIVVPAPGALALLGLGGMVGLRRRRS